MQAGSVVSYRQRHWVVLPNEDDEIVLLRPLTGNAEQVVAVQWRLSNHLGSNLPFERITNSSFPKPEKTQVADVNSALLLWQAARLSLREGASPLRSLGRISIRPRDYQFVPLLMALRLNPVRLFIADDVGVGKTIEAALIARELWDRKEIDRIVVFCPPYLCDQWEQELRLKFNLEAQIFSSGTINRLERNKPNYAQSVYEAYPIQVASIDFIKMDRNKAHFFTSLKDSRVLTILDEVHGAAQSENQNQQLRHAFLKELLEKKADMHVIMLTATPHSGIESAFRSLLSLIDPQFGEWTLSSLQEAQRRKLAKHFVQRTRKDIEGSWEALGCFPRREVKDETYLLSPEYRRLFDKTYEFCREIVSGGAGMAQHRQRVRNWGALNLLRCVMSSPRAAMAALEKRSLLSSMDKLESLTDVDEEKLFTAEEQLLLEATVEPSERTPQDETLPYGSVEAEKSQASREEKKLRDLKNLAREIIENKADTKLKKVVQVVRGLLKDGYSPIVWCYYVNTAEYVAEELARQLSEDWKGIQVLCITGRLSDEERRAKINELDPERRRVLVATDCLSEGINLQEMFTAALHYDLPWNPNRIEQREGRIDRYGQTAPTVKVIRYYGHDNIIDGEVLRVLLNKAKEIYDTLGTHVPIPVEERNVINVLLNALFFKRRTDAQMALPLDLGDIEALHSSWELSARREKEQRSRFAQHAIKPQEVAREVEEVDSVLGDPQAVEEFLRLAAQRLELPLREDPKQKGVLLVNAAQARANGTLPPAVSEALPQPKDGNWRIGFTSPTPAGVEYVGRNHPFVAALARYLFEAALSNAKPQVVARCGVMITAAVERATVLLLLRVRYLVKQQGHPSLFSEEVRLAGVASPNGKELRLKDALIIREEEARQLLLNAKPAQNLKLEEKQAWVERALGAEAEIAPALQELLNERARQLQEAHCRVRSALGKGADGFRVEVQHPADWLGMLVLLPHST